MTITAKITSKGNITLPKKVRDIRHLREGGVVVFEQKDNTFVIKPAKSLLDYKGYLRGRASELRKAAVKKVYALKKFDNADLILKESAGIWKDRKEIVSADNYV
jgi:AbrB family looped-hinge helix DNA binding protein